LIDSTTCFSQYYNCLFLRLNVSSIIKETSLIRQDALMREP